MATAPSDVRAALEDVTAAGEAEAAYLIEQGADMDDLLEAAPVIVASHQDAAALLAAEWYEESRDDVSPPRAYSPEPVTYLLVPKIGDSVGWAFRSSNAGAKELSLDANAQQALLLERLLPAVGKWIATGFWDTTTENVRRDKSAVGWQRFTRSGGCRFCRMLADRGAVYKKETASFAAHVHCRCIARAAFQGGEYGPEASAMQYIASQKRRSAEQKKRLREYLVENYPAA